MSNCIYIEVLVTFRMLKQTVILLASVCIVYAAVALQPLESKPKKFENVEGCYVKELDIVLPFGESAPAKNSCTQYTCGKSMLELITCGPPLKDTVGETCYEVEPVDEPYPDCCPYIECF